MNVLEKALAKAGYMRLGEALVFTKRNIDWHGEKVDHILVCPDKAGCWDFWERPELLKLADKHDADYFMQLVGNTWGNAYCTQAVYPYFIYECVCDYYFYIDSRKSKEYQYLADEIKSEINKNNQSCQRNTSNTSESPSQPSKIGVICRLKNGMIRGYRKLVSALIRGVQYLVRY